ncbi:MAG: hypothetical protein K0Q43_293 [Ramlibacter sp.]|jgi:hypothetical protein|nr:hypothetical protein [Ramlibacter sp.]
MTKKSRNQSPADKQAPMTGKVENDFNKQGEQVPTQKNEGRRTPESRTDREAHIGSDNQTSMRRGTTSHAPNKSR